MRAATNPKIDRQRIADVTLSGRNGVTGRRIAVIGGGISGLTAGYILARTDEVTVFEAATGSAGTPTRTWSTSPAAPPVAVDTGFIVYNERTYPLLTRLFARARGRDAGLRDEHVGQLLPAAECSTRASAGWPASAPACRAAVGPYLRMLAEVPRFHRAARRAARRRGGATSAAASFRSAISCATTVSPRTSRRTSRYRWSGPCGRARRATALRYPAGYLFAFLANHGMLSVSGSPPWRTVTGGSRRYVERIAAGLAQGAAVVPGRSVRRYPDGVTVRDASGRRARLRRRRHRHPPRSGAAAARPAHRGRAVGARRVPLHAQPGRAAHRHSAAAARAPAVRASWNYSLQACDGGSASRGAGPGQLLPEPAPGPAADARLHRHARRPARRRPGPRHRRDDYAHPAYTRESVAAQSRLPALNTAVTAFAGAYHGWGFHEDGCRSGRPPRGPAAAPGAAPRSGDRPGAATSAGIAHARRAPLRNGSATAATSGLSTSTSCRRRAGGRAAARRIPRPRPPGRPGRTIRANVDEFLRAPRHRPGRRPGADAGPRPGARLRVQPADRVLVPPRGRHAGVRDRRGAQHLRAAPRLPAAHRRPGPRPDGEGALRLAVPPGRRLVPDEPAAAGPSGWRSASPCTARTGTGSSPPSAAPPVPATRPALLRAAARHPWSTVAVSARIRWQGIKLYARGTAAGAAAAARSSRGGSVIRGHTVISTTHDTGWRDRPGPVARCRGGARIGGRAARSPALLFRAAVARLPIRVRLPGGRRSAPGDRRAAHGGAQPGRLLHPARRGRPDRIRRVLPGRRLGLRGPDRAADRLRHVRRRPRAAAAAADAPAWPVRRQPAADEQTKDGARRNISRHYDLSNEFFALFLDETMTYSSALFETAADGIAGRRRPAARRRRSGARSTGCSTRRGVGPGSPAARDRHRLGRTGDPGPPARRDCPHGHDLRQAARARGPPGGRGRAAPIGSAWNCATTGTWTASTTPSARWRWSRRSASATGTPTSPSSTGCSRPAAGSRSRRSRCRTTGCWPAGTPTPGSRSTSSPAA